MKVEVRKIPKKSVTLLEPKRSMIVDKEKYRQRRVAAYCRVSTDSEEQLTSYTTQKRVYTEMIAANKEWQLAGIYADEGISGTRADKRQEFQRMIKDCQFGKIDYIITKSVSRFARNTVDCLETVRMLKAMGIGVFFEEQNIDTLKSDSELYLVIYAGFAQSESESISKNITWSFRKNFEDGKCIFMYKKLLGYKKGNDGQPEIVPYEAEIVERIYDMYLGGQTTRTISETLKAENIEIPGKSFTFSSHMIENILKNEKYCGDCILQKTVTTGYLGFEDISNVIFIDDVTVIDNVSPSFLKYYEQGKGKYNEGELSEVIQVIDHKISLIYKLSSTNDIIESIVSNDSYDKILGSITNILNDSIVIRDEKFVCSSDNLDIANLAMGSKLFAILLMLISNGSINEKTLLILDEPEAHLHPSWQNKLAEIIVLLMKQIGIKILITSHSPNFILALQTYSIKYKVEQECNFYTTQKKEDNYIIDYKRMNDELTKIYADFAIPFSQIKAIYDALSNGENYD